MNGIKWTGFVVLSGLIGLLSSAHAYDRQTTGSDYVDAINSEAKSIPRNNIKINVDESFDYDKENQRADVEDMLERLKRLTTHGRH